MKRIKLRFLLIPVIMVTLLLEGVNIFLSNQVTTESVTVTKLSQQIEEYEQQNFTLRSEMLEYTSLDAVASRAAQLGYKDTKKVISLYEAPNVAINVR